MKKYVIIILIMAMHASLLCMEIPLLSDYEMSERSLGKKSDWLLKAQRLAEDVKRNFVAYNNGTGEVDSSDESASAEDIKKPSIVVHNDDTPGDDSDESASAEESEVGELQEGRSFLLQMYSDYNDMMRIEGKLDYKLLLTAFCQGVRVSPVSSVDNKIITAAASKLNVERVVDNEIIAAAWLYLVSNPAHKNFFKEHMFSWAITHKKMQIIEYLVESEGVDVTESNFVGEMPICTACKAGDEAVVRFLLKKNALYCRYAKKRGVWVAKSFGNKEIAEIIGNAAITPKANSRCVMQ